MHEYQCYLPITGTGTPGQNTPLIYAKRQPAFATQRERLYRAGPGKYVATENVEPKQSDDIPLRRGMEVEGKDIFWICKYLVLKENVAIYIYKG